MSYTPDQLQALRDAFARGERRVTFGDKTVEYRTVQELKDAMREVERAIAAQSGTPQPRQVRVDTSKGW